MSSRFLLLFPALALFASCKEGEEKDYPPEPSIEMISVSPLTLSEGQSTINISFKYVDGDGDLGENNPDVKNLFVTDNRVNITYSFRVRELAPRGSAIPITGTLNVELPSPVITNGASQQTVNYSLYIVDRSGHASNVISTQAITVYAQ